MRSQAEGPSQTAGPSRFERGEVVARYIHECGCPIRVANRWDGLSPYFQFYDGREGSGGETINHCPVCDGRLSLDTLCEEESAASWAGLVARWLNSWPAVFLRSLHR